MIPQKQDHIYFEGHNWHDLDRLVTLARFHFLSNSEYDLDPQTRLNHARAGYLVQSFRGPALDWASTLMGTPTTFGDFDVFVTACKNHFGIQDETLRTLQREELDNLSYAGSVPEFFANFDRLTLQLGVTADETRIIMVRSKLPDRIKAILAEQALVFADYQTMRQRLITMWTLDPHVSHTGERVSRRAKAKRKAGKPDSPN